MSDGKAWRRKHVRLENFLQRKLSEEYARVAWYEPCVVVAPNCQPRFCFVVVTDEHLYVVSNPPRYVHSALEFLSVNAIDLVNDYPEFLSGQDRQNSQHIRVRYARAPEDKVKDSDQRLPGDGRDSSVDNSGRTSSTVLRPCSSSSMLQLQSPTSPTSPSAEEASRSRAPSVLSASYCSETSKAMAQGNVKPDKEKIGRRKRLRRLLLGIPTKLRDRLQAAMSGGTSKSASQLHRSTNLDTDRPCSQAPPTKRSAPQGSTEEDRTSPHLINSAEGVRPLTPSAPGTPVPGAELVPQLENSADEEGAVREQEKEDQAKIVPHYWVEDERRPPGRTEDERRPPGKTENERSEEREMIERPFLRASSGIELAKRPNTVNGFLRQHSFSMESGASHFQNGVDMKFDRSPVGSLPWPSDPRVSEEPSSDVSNDDVIAGLLQLPPPKTTKGSRHQTERPCSLAAALAPQALAAAVVGVRAQTALGTNEDHKFFPHLQELGFRPPQPEPQTREIHLYVLTTQRPVYCFLYCTWNTLLIRSTLQLETISAQLRNGFRSSGEGAWNDLQRHLLSQQQGQQSFDYADELGGESHGRGRQALEVLAKDVKRHPAAKRAFWKEPSLFPSLIDKLRHLVSEPSNKESQSIGAAMDRLKVCSVLLNLLVALLQDTEVIPERAHHLTLRNGQRCRDLLGYLCSFPWVPPRYKDRVASALTCYKRLTCPDWELTRHAPLIRSIAEVTHDSASVLYSLLQIAYQGWELDHKQAFGASWIVEVFTENEDWENYCDRLVSSVLSMVSPGSTSGTLTPTQSVLLHRHLCLLLALATHSTAMDNRLRTNYADDFKYFLLRKVIGHKLPEDYPIRTSLLLLVEGLRNHVLSKGHAPPAISRAGITQ